MVGNKQLYIHLLGRVKRIWYLSLMRAAKVQASLRIRAVSPEPPLLAHASSETRGTFRQKTRSLAPLNGWACTVKICHDGMLEDTNSLDGALFIINKDTKYSNNKTINSDFLKLLLLSCWTRLIYFASFQNIAVMSRHLYQTLGSDHLIFIVGVCVRGGGCGEGGAEDFLKKKKIRTGL